MPQFNRATASMRSLGTLILKDGIGGKEINDKLASVIRQLNAGELTEENINLFCTYVRKLIQLLESIKIYAEREQFIDEKVLLEWESHIKENKISQFEIGTQKILDSIHDVFLKVAPKLKEQGRDEIRLMRGRYPVHHSFANILLNDKTFYRRMAAESVNIGQGSEKRYTLRYAAQNALLKLSSQPNKENLEAFRNSLAQLLNHLNWHIVRLFNVEEEDEILESHLVKEINMYIEICKKKNLGNLERKLIALKNEVVAYFTRDLKDADRMFRATRKLIKESLKEKEEDKDQLIVEELIDINSDYFHQAYEILKSTFDEGIIEAKSFIRNCLRTKLAGNSFPIINHLIIERIGNKVNAVLYGQYMVRSNVGLIGYVAGKSSSPFKMLNQLRLTFQSDARRHGNSNVWLYISEMKEEKGRIKDSTETRVMCIAMKRYGAIPLDLDYYQYPLGVEITSKTEPVMLVLFAFSPSGRINGLLKNDLLKVLIPFHEDIYETPQSDPFFKMTIDSFKNKPFIGVKPIKF